MLNKKLLCFVDVVAAILTSLSNLSIESGIIPSIWKLAKVTRLFKKGYKQDPSNYRPTSVLPTMSKILEKAVHTQLYAYLCDSHLLSDKQIGFRLKA